MMDLRTLTVIDYDDFEARRVTLAPHSIKYVVSRLKDIKLQDQILKKVSVYFDDGDNITLHISELDLHSVEQAIGLYDVSPC